MKNNRIKFTFMSIIVLNYTSRRNVHSTVWHTYNELLKGNLSHFRECHPTHAVPVLFALCPLLRCNWLFNGPDNGHAMGCHRADEAKIGFRWNRRFNGLELMSGTESIILVGFVAGGWNDVLLREAWWMSSGAAGCVGGSKERKAFSIARFEGNWHRIHASLVGHNESSSGTFPRHFLTECNPEPQSVPQCIAKWPQIDSL